LIRPPDKGAAARLDEEGLKVALVEHGRSGGTCVNDGCTPQGAHC
jgi:pyruvate/2-oxoglutarate dehydrogenase complex dihydrolipoamide dehydrogenase (E3) component